MFKHKSSEPSGLDFSLYLNMRWIAFFGQASAILLLVMFSDQKLFWQAIIPFLASFLIGNIYVYMEKIRIRSKKESKFMPEVQSIFMLILDTLQISGIIAVSGGLKNPFFIYIAAPAVLAASLLGLKPTIIVGASAFISIIGTAFIHNTSNLEALAAIDNWDTLLSIAAFSFVLLYLLFFLNPLTRQIADHRHALHISEKILSEQRELFKIAAVATSLAHELGTPLTTITITSKELERDLRNHLKKFFPQHLDSGKLIAVKKKDKKDTDLHSLPLPALPLPDHVFDDLKILQSQAKRCSKLLADISSDHILDLPHLHLKKIDAIIDSCIGQCKRQNLESADKEIKVEILGDDLSINFGSDLYFAIYNIISNAISFAKKTIEIAVFCEKDTIKIIIQDDGPGFSKKHLDKQLIPFKTLRKDKKNHLGLGLFVANLTLISIGGKIEISNKPYRKGAIVTVIIDKKLL